MSSASWPASPSRAVDFDPELDHVRRMHGEAHPAALELDARRGHRGIVFLLANGHPRERSSRLGGHCGGSVVFPHPAPARKTIGTESARSSSKPISVPRATVRHEPAAGTASTREARTPGPAQEERAGGDPEITLNSHCRLRGGKPMNCRRVDGRL